MVAPPPIEKGCETSFVAGEMGECSDKSYELAPLYEIAARDCGCHFLDAGLHAGMNPVDFMHLDKKGHLALSLALADYIAKEITGKE